MSNKELLEAMNTMFNRKLAPIYSKLDTFEERFDTMEKNFDTAEKNFDTMEKNFDTMEEKFNTMEERFKAMEETQEKMSKKLDMTYDQVSVLTEKDAELERRVNMIQGELTETKEVTRTNAADITFLKASS